MSGTSAPRPLPRDDELPGAATLLDVYAMAPHLDRLFGALVSNVRLRYIDYVPGEALTVQYSARLPGADSSIVESFATANGGAWTIHMEDDALPLLSASQTQLTDSLGLRPSEVERLAWIPQRRAVLRCGDVVVKLYGDQAELSRAERALEAVGTKLPTARLIGSHREQGAVVQQRLRGEPLERRDASACTDSASLLLRRLHALQLDDLPALGPAQLLSSVERPVALAAFARPQLRKRLSSLRETLRATMPEPADLVPVHGDFNVGQLLSYGRRLNVVDFDTLGRGSPSVDLAAFAANLHNGRDGDDQDVHCALARMSRAYGHAPPDLTWHLAVTMLRRVDRPIRRFKRHWPERTTAIVSAIELLIARL